MCCTWVPLCSSLQLHHLRCEKDKNSCVALWDKMRIIIVLQPVQGAHHNLNKLLPTQQRDIWQHGMSAQGSGAKEVSSKKFVTAGSRPTMRWSTSTAMTFLAHSSRRIVRLPVPGPISRTTSVLLIPALSTIDWTICGFFRMC